MSQRTKVAELAVDINVVGAAATNAALTNVERKGQSASMSLRDLTAKAAGAAAAIGSLVAATDRFFTAAESYNRIAGRLALVTKNSGEAADVQSRLFQLAQRTGAEFEGVAGQYSRIALAAKDLNASQAEVLRIVEAVNKSLQISGSSAQEAAGSSTQFVQALSSGKLQAEELNSILDGNSFLASQIAAGMGLSVGGLRAAVKEGGVLGTTVLNAVLARTLEIDSAFDKLGSSMERSGTRFGNSFDRALASIDNKIGASSRLAAFMDYLSGSIDQNGAFDGLFGGIYGGSALLVGRAPIPLRPAGDFANSGGRVPSRPLVGVGSRPTAAPIRVTADAPRVRRSGGSGSARGQGFTGESNPMPLGGTLRRGALESIASTIDAARQARFQQARDNINGMGFSQESIVDTIADDIGEKMKKIEATAKARAQAIGSTLVDALSTGISTAVQSGSLGEGFRAMGATLLGGLGRMVVDFGKQAFLVSSLMEKFKNALMTFKPQVGLVASLGLIALGSVMIGLGQRAARSSFSGAGRSDGFSGGGFTLPASSISSATVFGAPSSIIADGRTPITSTAGSSVTAATPMVVNVFSPDDPVTQRFFREVNRRADGRGSL